MIIDWKKALNIYKDIKEKISKLDKKLGLWVVLVLDNEYKKYIE